MGSRVVGEQKCAQEGADLLMMGTGVKRLQDSLLGLAYSPALKKSRGHLEIHDQALRAPKTTKRGDQSRGNHLRL